MTLTKLKERVKLELGISSGELQKTGKMFELERRYQQNIKQLLAGHLNGQQLADEYGVTRSTISFWRKKLNIQVLNNEGQFQRKYSRYNKFSAQ